VQHRVVFPSDEPQIIGYGGDIDMSDDEDEVDNSNYDRVEGTGKDEDNEIDVALRQLTNQNTQFNSHPGNLQLTPPPPVNNATKPIIVSITPFSTTPKAADSIKRSQPIDKNSKFRPNKQFEENTKTMQDTRVQTENKLNGKLTASNKVANLLDKAKKKVNQFPVISDTLQVKGNKTAELPSHGNAINDNKPIVLDVYPLPKEPSPNALTVVMETKKSETFLVVDNKPSDLPKNEAVSEEGNFAVHSSVTSPVENKTNEENFTELQKMIGGEEVVVFEAVHSVQESIVLETEVEIAAAVGDDANRGLVPDSDLESETVSKDVNNLPSPLPEPLIAVPDLTTPIVDDKAGLVSHPSPSPVPKEASQFHNSSYLPQVSTLPKPKIGTKPKIPAKPASILNGAKLPTRPSLAENVSTSLISCSIRTRSSWRRRHWFLSQSGPRVMSSFPRSSSEF